jgi:Tfp pilus assembly protein PilO
LKFLRFFSELTIGRTIIMALFVSAGYFFLYFDPGTAIEEEIVRTEARLAEQTKRREEINKTMKKEEEMRANTLQLKRNLEVVKAKLPNELKDTQMQSLIYEASKKSNIAIDTLKADASVVRDPNAPPVKINIEDVRPENLIEEVKFQIVMSGTFDAFLMFLDTLAKEDKVIKIRNFRIAQLSAGVEENRILFEGEIIGFKQAKIEIVPRAR